MSLLNIKNIDYMTVVASNHSNNFKPNTHHNGDEFVNWGNNHGLRIFAVIDGAKAPFDYSVNGLPNDAFAAKLFATLIKQNFSVITDISQWESALTACIVSYQSTFDIIRFNNPTFKMEDYRYFNAACAFTLALIDENTGDCVVLNATDCYMCVRQAGQVVNLSDYNESEMIANGFIDRAVTLSDRIAQGKTLEEAQKLEYARILANRKKVYNQCLDDNRNQWGMPVMNGDIELLDCLQVDTFNVIDRQIDAFIAMSDGYMCKHDDVIATATGALNDGCEYFYFHHIKPLWGQQVMSDITCAVLTYQ